MENGMQFYCKTVQKCKESKIYLLSHDFSEQSVYMYIALSGGEHGNSFQCSYLDNSMDKGAWWDTVHSVTQSWT